MIPIQFSSIVDSVKANKDRSLTIKIETQELTAEDTSKIFSLMGLQIWTAMSETIISNEEFDIPESVPEFKGDKTPSQRLRDRMYVYFKEKHGKTDGFKAWYETALEKIGETYLNKLE